MYCFNCREKLGAGEKFCSKCKTKQLVHSEGEAKREEIRRQYIEEVFYDVFKDKRIFGNQVHIIGKNSVSQEIKENLEEYYLEDSMEKPLLAFDYEKEMEEGFAITNHRLVWYYSYPSRGLQEVEIDNIKNVLIGKRGLATVMQVVDKDNNLSSDIYLTGIDNVSAFVTKFSKFIDEVYLLVHGDETDEDYEEDYYRDNYYGNDYYAEEISEGNRRGANREIKDMLIKACHTVNIDLIYCEIGNPVVYSTSKKYYNARNNFGIPNEDDIFFIYDATVFGSCQKGFAICDSGIYYCGHIKGCWTWKEFKKLNITCGFSGLKMGEEVFTTAGNDGKKTLDILGTIQEYLR
jgi:hypothetical protein